MANVRVIEKLLLPDLHQVPLRHGFQGVQELATGAVQAVGDDPIRHSSCGLLNRLPDLSTTSLSINTGGFSNPSRTACCKHTPDESVPPAGQLIITQ